MGNQGLLRRDSSGEWHRERFLDGRPTPLEGGLDGLEWELLLPFPFIALATNTFAGLGWGVAPPVSVPRHRALRTAAIAAGLLLAALILSTTSPPGAVVPLVAVIPWALRSAGVIESYELATTIAVATLIGGFVVGVLELRQLQVAAPRRGPARVGRPRRGQHSGVNESRTASVYLGSTVTVTGPEPAGSPMRCVTASHVSPPLAPRTSFPSCTSSPPDDVMTRKPLGYVRASDV